MRPLALLSLLCASALAASAQPSGVYLTGAFTRTQFDGERLAVLSDGFNDYYSESLQAPVTLLPGEATQPGFGAAGRINAGGLAVGLLYQYGRSEHEAVAEYANGMGTRVTSRVLDHFVTIEMTTDAIGPVVLGVMFGGVFRDVRIESATIYQDGSESLGTEFTLNGVYTVPSYYIEAGFVAGLQVGDRIYIPVRFLLPIGTGDDRLPAIDFDVFELNDYFPRDWDRWVRDVNGLDDNAAVTDLDYQGPRLQIGVEFRIL